MYEERFTRVIGYAPILLEERQLMWNAAGLPPTDTPFQIELPAGFDFGKYVWGTHGAEWAAIQEAGRLRYELRFSWAHKHPIPDGTPFVGDVRHADIAKAPRVLVLGYVIDPDSDLIIWDNHMEVSSTGKHVDRTKRTMPANKRRMLNDGGFMER
ncbi:hypothetical protein LRP88_06512 [Fusarium phalaenopsidis]